MLYTIIRYLCVLYRRVQTILDNNRAEGQVPEHILADLARCFARAIPALFAESANQEAYKRWLQEREQQLAQEQSDKIDSAACQQTKNDGGTL